MHPAEGNLSIQVTCRKVGRAPTQEEIDSITNSVYHVVSGLANSVRVDVTFDERGGLAHQPAPVRAVVLTSSVDTRY